MRLTATAVRRIAVAMQLGGAYGVALALVRLADWNWMAALAGGIATVLVLFALSIAMAFAISVGGTGALGTGALGTGTFGAGMPTLPAPLQAHRAASRLGPRQALLCFVRECIAVFRMFNWLQPFRHRHPLTPPSPPGTQAAALRPPVLLVHGYGCNRAVWLDLQPALAAAGYRCEAIDLVPMLADIDEYADALLAAMQALHRAAGRAPLLLCHSMGGLAARAALARARREGRSAPCAGIVTLGTPHHGCTLASIGSGANARQMRCGNDWLQALARSEGPRERAAMVSIFSWHDSIAGPAETSWLDGADNVALAGIGHVTLLRDARAIDATLSALDRLARASAPAAS
ncbi:alpha/beta fold hydrolase [Cupriavidus gilardii]|uniref:esterase/lipase family protein n=1 Tax=Cupriavidus gilardii TaxID=82541 RepID=UPI001ABEC37E|nr:alpha/beta fold hydrolase [Cupriavidus gilardii]MBO4119991.1 alpha/beta fold hydrolase [Cupriavidus gilardii]